MSGWDFLNIAVTGTPIGPFTKPQVSDNLALYVTRPPGQEEPEPRRRSRRPVGCYGDAEPDELGEDQ